MRTATVRTQYSRSTATAACRTTTDTAATAQPARPRPQRPRIAPCRNRPSLHRTAGCISLSASASLPTACRNRSQPTPSLPQPCKVDTKGLPPPSLVQHGQHLRQGRAEPLPARPRPRLRPRPEDDLVRTQEGRRPAPDTRRRQRRPRARRRGLVSRPRGRPEEGRRGSRGARIPFHPYPLTLLPPHCFLAPSGRKSSMWHMRTKVG